jgi:hypothetical protein
MTFALGTASAYCATVSDWGTTTVDDGRPRPPSTLRSVPPV